jgi:uncharacterized protein YbjT (DUF2867 family)
MIAGLAQRHDGIKKAGMAKTKTIVVTGATGGIAGQLIPHLLKGGHKVRGLVRSRDKGAALAKQGVELVEGDLERPRSLVGVFDGADAVMLIAPAGARAPQHSSSALWAARQAKVGRVVRLSAVGAAHDAPTINSRLHALSDHEVAVSGLPYTILKPHFFMQNLVFMTRQSILAEGKIYAALGDAKLGMIDTTDVGEVAARVLVDDGHAGKTYTPTGPRSISMHEVAAAFAEALGKPVKYVAIPTAAADQAMAGFGMDELTRTFMTDYLEAYARNWGDLVTEDVPRILGRPARSISEFARAAAPAFRG